MKRFLILLLFICLLPFKVEANNHKKYGLITKKYGIQSGMVAWWEMDEVSGSFAFDTVNYGTIINSGTIIGAARVSGRFNNGLSFDGDNDYLTVKDSNNLDVSSITIAIYIRGNNLSGGSQGLIGKNYATNPYWAFYTQGNGLKWEISSSTGFYTSTTVGANLTNQNNYLIVLIQSGKIVDIYLNNNLIKSDTLGLDFSQTINANSLDIGRLGTAGYYFNGIIDEVAIWNRALSRVEISQLYKRPIFILNDND